MQETETTSRGASETHETSSHALPFVTIPGHTRASDKALRLSNGSSLIHGSLLVPPGERNSSSLHTSPERSIVEPESIHPPETPGELRRFLESLGRRPTKALGQNFLVDRNLARLVAESAEILSSDRVVEVGSGLGALTRHLIERAGFVRCVERDRFLLEACRGLFPPGERLAYWDGDVLAG
ncbi:MAG: rRNA adenine N-6-methyltransferase family protein, partial [Planctomycetota bacterium]